MTLPLERIYLPCFILHFVENIKPWNDRDYPEKEEWLHYFRKSVFKNTQLSYIERPSAMRKWTVKTASMFIVNKKRRRKFREKVWGTSDGAERVFFKEMNMVIER